MKRREGLFDFKRKKADLPGPSYTWATARMNSELSLAMAGHEKGVSFREVESIAKGWAFSVV